MIDNPTAREVVIDEIRRSGLIPVPDQHLRVMIDGVWRVCRVVECFLFGRTFRVELPDGRESELYSCDDYNVRWLETNPIEYVE